MSSFTLGHYYSADSPIHRLDPRVKLALSFIMMIVIFLLGNFWQLLIYAIFLLICQRLSKVPMHLILRSLRPVLWIALFAFVVNLLTVPGRNLWTLGPIHITYEGLYVGVRMVVRLVLLLTTSSLFLTLTTTPLLLADSLESILSPLKLFRVPVHDLAMMMSIALRFVPTLAEEADKIMKAQSSRGANYDSGKIKDRLKGIISILVPLFVSAIYRAEDLALAMEARCYRGGEGRTKLRQLRFQRRDLIFTLAVAVMFGGLIAAGVLGS